MLLRGHHVPEGIGAVDDRLEPTLAHQVEDSVQVGAQRPYGEQQADFAEIQCPYVDLGVGTTVNAAGDQAAPLGQGSDAFVPSL